MRVWKLLRAALAAALNDHLLDFTAALAYYFLFSLFPLMLLLAALLGAVHLTGLVNHAVAALARRLPRDAAQLVGQQLRALLVTRHPGLISFGTLLALFAASQGFSELITALDIAYQVPETRPYWRRQLLAVGLTLTAGILMVAALALLLLGRRLLVLVGGASPPSAVWMVFWPVVRWGVVIALFVPALALLYKKAPNVHLGNAGILPAAGTAFMLWIIISALLAAYLDHLGNYSAVYGSLGAVIALMLWFYLLALALLLGAEVHRAWLRERGIAIEPKVRTRSTAEPKT